MFARVKDDFLAVKRSGTTELIRGEIVKVTPSNSLWWEVQVYAAREKYPVPRNLLDTDIPQGRQHYFSAFGVLFLKGDRKEREDF